MAKPTNDDKRNKLLWVLGLTAAGLSGWWAYRKFFATQRRKALAKQYGGRTYQLTAENGEQWTWSEDDLEDTLYESGVWENKHLQVDALDVGEKLVVEGETLQRLS